MEMPVSLTPVDVPERDSSLGFRGLYEVFAQPTAFFSRLKNDPKVLVPYVAYTILILVFLYATAPFIAQMQIDEMQRRAAENPSFAMPSSMNAGTMVPFIIIFGALASAIGPLLIAGLAYLWGNFVMAGRASFKQLLSVVLFGELIFLVGSMLLLPLMLAKQSILVSFSLAALIPPDPKSVLWVALSKASIFFIWEIIAVGIGMAIIYSFPRNKGYVLAVLSVGLVSVVHVLMTAVGSMF
jgi:hypothetical protein